MFNDFGDFEGEDADQILASYHKWLHKIANAYLDPWDERHDDLVQEGRIAMWKALATYNPSKGALPTWITTAAKMRMKDVAFGSGQPTGREATRGKKEVKATSSVEALMEEGLEEFLGASDALEGVEWSYHRGEIWKALETLTPAMRRYVVARFWLGLNPASMEVGQRELRKLVPELSKTHVWNAARERLQKELAHLATV